MSTLKRITVKPRRQGVAIRTPSNIACAFRRIAKSDKLAGAATVLELVPDPEMSISRRVRAFYGRLQKRLQKESLGVCKVIVRDGDVRIEVWSTFPNRLGSEWVETGDCLRHAMMELQPELTEHAGQ